MKKLRNILCLILALALVQAPLLSMAEEAEEPVAEAAAETAEPVDMEFPEELIVGHPTITKGDFFTELFGNDTADIDVRALIHGDQPGQNRDCADPSHAVYTREDGG